MPRKKTTSEGVPDVLPPQGLDLMEALGHLADDMAADSTDAMLLAMDFEKTLVQIAHTISAQAIDPSTFDTEDQRAGAAHRQVELLAALYLKLQDLTAVKPS